MARTGEERRTSVSSGNAAAQGVKRPARGRTPSRDVKSALTDAAEAVLMREGPAAVTVRAVAAEAGVAPMGVYNRFGSKDGLIEALLIRGFEGLTAAISARPGEIDPLERLWMSGVRYREFALSHRAHYALMFGDPGEGEIEMPEELKDCAGTSFQVLVDHVAMAIAAGRLAGEDPVLMAQQIWSAVHGAVSLEMTGKLSFAEPETSYRHLLQMLFRGFAVAGAIAFPDPDGPPKAA
jgi:AcrR family transcriptional regulator